MPCRCKLQKHYLALVILQPAIILLESGYFMTKQKSVLLRIETINREMEENINDRKWKVLSSEYVYRDVWLTARKDCVQLPTGAIIPKYYVLEYPEWVTTIAITKDKKFVFVRQYRHGLQETRYELCAGVCDPSDKSPMDAAKRELWEETGYGNGSWRQIMVISANASAMTNHTHCFVATDVERVSEPHQEAGEDVSVHLLTLENVRSLLHNDEIKQATQAAPLWKYLSEGKLI